MRIIPASAAPENQGLANPFINSDMRWAQRGPTFVAAANGQIFVDRMLWAQSGGGAVTVSRSGSGTTPIVTGGPVMPFASVVTVTTADASIGATGRYHVIHRIEGSNAAPFMQRQFTLGFFVMSSVTGIHCVAFSNSVGDRTYVAEYTVNAANTWEWKTITVSASPSAGTWDYGTGIGMQVSWALAAGSSTQTTAGSWQSGGPFYATSNQVNAMGTNGNVFRITGLDMVPGPTIPMYRKPRLDGQELLLCQRYFWKNNPPDTAPAASQAQAYRAHYNNPSVAAIANGEYYITEHFAVPMRTTPSPTIYPYTSPVITNGVVTNSQIASNGGGTDYAASSAVAASLTATTIAINNQSGGNLTLSANNLVFVGLLMNAEL